MNFNPQERMSLQNLLAALQGGVDPGVANTFLSDILAQQASRVDQRKALALQQQQQAAAEAQAQQEQRLDRRQGLVQLVTEAATSGYPMEQVQMLADLATPNGGIPPAAKQAIGIAFPGGEPTQGFSHNGGLYDIPAGTGGGLSPLYTESAPYINAQQQMEAEAAAAQQELEMAQAEAEAEAARTMEEEQQAADIEASYAQFATFAIQAKQQGIPPLEFIQRMGAAVPQILSSDPGRVKQIMDSVYGSNWNLAVPSIG